MTAASSDRSEAGVHAWFLRGINVGGKHALPMIALRQHLTELGAVDVHTYIQSGNVVFRAEPALAAQLVRGFEEESAQRYGFVVPVVARTALELAAAVAANPYLAHRDPLPERADGLDSTDGGPVVDHKRYHVGFLRQPPEAALVASVGMAAAVAEEASGAADVAPSRGPPERLSERCAILGHEVYFDLPGGMGTSKLMTSRALAPLLRLMTVRNWRTVLKMLALTQTSETAAGTPEGG